MEIVFNTYKARFFYIPLLVIALLAGSHFFLQAQPVKSGISINQDVVYLALQRGITDNQLQEMAVHYELQELPLKDWLKGKNLDKAGNYGWKFEKQEGEWLIFSRPIQSIGDISKLEKKILIAAQHKSGDDLYPAGVFKTAFGFNILLKTDAVAVNEGVVSIFLAGYNSAKEVKLAGSFSQWEQKPLTMQKTEDGWKATFSLQPGKYFYKLIVDGKWLIHKENLLKENDGKGNVNSVFYVYNKKFVLKGYQQAKRVFVTGSFNGWSTREATMHRSGGGWELPVFLPEGTHTYRFIVDDVWMEDPSATARLKNEFGGYNSAVMIGKPYIFRLDGFEDAKEVILSGSFNGWREGELELKPARGGWELPYVIGAGNHEYYYLVDGHRIGRVPDKGRTNGKSEPLNFNIIIAPNHTFTLKDYKTASAVYLSGSFNNWSETGFPMQFENGEWKLPVFLAAGKQTYKFIVDGKWMIDPANRQWEQNEHGTKNSVLWVEGN